MADRILHRVLNSRAAIVVGVASLFLIAGCAKERVVNPHTFTVQPSAVKPRLTFLWQEQLGSWKFLSSEPKEFATPSHVASSDELVVATSEGEVLKFQASNGRILWQQRFAGEYHAGAVVGSGRAFVADLQGSVRALDLRTGAVVWQTQLPNSVETRGSYSDGRLFFSDAADKLHALDAATGEELWTVSRDVPEYFTVKGSCTPVIDDDAVYCGFSDGALVAIQIDSGDVIWEVDLSDGKKNFADVDGAVRVVGDRIYAASYAGGVYALDRMSGAPIWHSRVESAADFAISDGRFFVASALGRVVALALEDGEPLWSFKLNGSFPGSLAVFGPYIVTLATDGPVYVIDADTGYPHLKWIGSSGFGAPVEPGSSRLYALSNQGKLLGLKLGY